MAKNNKVLLIIGIGLLAIALIGAFKGTPLFSTISASQSCSEAMDKYTLGAAQGECFVASGPNSVTGVSSGLSYVESIIESSRVGPSGFPEDFCKIDYTQSLDKTLTCTEAFTSSDYTPTVQVCIADSDCDNNMCVNHICRIGLVSDCSYEGEIRCLSTTEYNSCLSSGKWSGQLYCPSGKACSSTGCTDIGGGPICGNDACETGESSSCPSDCQYEPPADNNTSGTDDTDTNGSGLDSTTIMYGLGGLGALLVILSLTRK